MNKLVSGIMLTLLLIGVLASAVKTQGVPLGVCSGAVSSIDFTQMNFNLSGTTYSNTDWGSVDLAFTGQESIMYFNLAVDGSWQVQNVPVLSIEGVGVTQAMSFAFDLGVQSGSDVTSVNYGYSFTDATVDSMPAETNTAAVLDQDVVAGSGLIGEEIPPLQPAKPQVGGTVSSPIVFSTDANFPNQECGINECAPTAVSNGLQHLNRKHNLGIQDNNISIAKMKEATGWANGAPVNWGELKKAYMENNNYPISTEIVTDLSKLAKMDLKDQVVEICGGHHAAAVVGITDLGGGNYKIDVAHDTNQGPPGNGGTKTEPITYNSTTNTFSGSPGLFDGSIFRYVVVECPKIVYVPYIDISIPIHNTFNAPVRITTIGGVSSWKVGFRFDPYLLECVSFTEGPYLSDAGTTTWTPGTVDNVNGIVTSHICALEQGKYQNGTGVLAYITFRVISYGNTTINLTDEDGDPCECMVLDPEGNEIPLALVNGEVRTSILGDVNRDGTVDMADISLCIVAFMSDPNHGPWDVRCDLNEDGSVDMADISIGIDNFMLTE